MLGICLLPKFNKSALPSPQSWGLSIVFVGLFLMGGSARDDVESLALLHPIMILCCGAAVVTFKREHWLDNRGLLTCTAVVLLLAASYLFPLSALRGHFPNADGDAAEISAAVNSFSAWQPAAVAPTVARQSFFFLFAPLAVILFAVQLDRAELRLTLLLVIAVGVISGLMGILQLVGSNSGPLYLYRTTNNGSAVGLFANRNHAAVLLACLFPMLAVFVTNRGGKSSFQIFAIALVSILIPLLLVTGSRIGILSAIIGLIGGALLYISGPPLPGEPKAAKSAAPLVVAAVVSCLILVTMYFSRAEAIERIFADGGKNNDRGDFWNSSLQLFWHYFPWGFGPGGFAQVFQKVEPVSLLDRWYLNRLHNDWLETSLALGVPGIMLLLCGTGYYLIHSFRLWIRREGSRSSGNMGRMASIVIAILAVASLSDYPLRTPAIMGFAALALVWFIDAPRHPGVNHRERSNQEG